MISYIFLIAVLNIALGFAVAVHLGRRYRTLLDADGQFEFEDVLDSLETAASGSAEHVEASEDFEDEVPSDEPREKSDGELSVEDLQAEVNVFHEQLSDADEQLRACLETPDALGLEEILGSLRAATEEFQEKRNAAHKRYAEVHNENDAFADVSGKLQSAIELQDEQLASTNAAIDAFDYDGDIEDGCRTFVGEAGKLLESNNTVRSHADGAMLEVVRQEGRLGSLDSNVGKDALTGLANRVGAEAKLLEWWNDDPNHVRELSLALVDMDEFSKHNEEHGQNVCNEILQATVRMLEKEAGSEAFPSRYSGQQFMFMFPDVEIRNATNAAERMRQTMEKAHILRRGEEIKVTISCAVAAAVEGDTTETLLDRSEATLREAKRYGRNRTFVHDGEYPTPVVPPNFDIDEKKIEL